MYSTHIIIIQTHILRLMLMSAWKFGAVKHLERARVRVTYYMYTHCSIYCSVLLL